MHGSRLHQSPGAALREHQQGPAWVRRRTGSKPVGVSITVTLYIVSENVCRRHINLSKTAMFAARGGSANTPRAHG